MRNPVKEKLQNGEVALGTFVGIGHPDVTEMLSVAGFDWLLLDGEHGPLGFEIMQTMMQSMRGNTCVPIVRVQWNDPVIIKRALDIGAYGILVPWVNSREEAEAAVAACKYPPKGIRGLGPRRAARIMDDYVAQANDKLLVAVQIETTTAIENIDDILAVDGVDAVYIGPADLGISIQAAPPNSNTPTSEEAFDIVLKAAEKAGKPAGIFAFTQNIESHIERGFRFISVGNDDMFLKAGAKEAVQKAQSAIAKKG